MTSLKNPMTPLNPSGVISAWSNVMRGIIVAISALLLGAGALNFGLGLQSSLLGLRGIEEGFSPILTGLIMSSYYAGFVLGGLYAPHLVNKVGHIRTFSALASLASAAALCHAVFVDPVSWALFRLLTGACFAGLSLVTESWLNEKSTNVNRGAILSIYFVVILGGTGLGQLCLTLAPVTGYDLFVLVSVILSVALVPIALTTTPMPTEIEPTWMRFRKLYRKSPVGVVGCFGAGLGTGAFWSLGAVYAQGIGMDTYHVSIFMALMVFGGMATQLPLGKLSDKFDRRIVLGGQSLVMTGFGIFVGVFANGTEHWLAYAGMGAGGLLLPLYGISIAHANDQLEQKDYVPAGATLLLLYGCGATVGPFIATIFMEYMGPQGLFIHAALMTLCVAAFCFYRMTRRANVHEDDMVEFGLVPRTSAMTFVLDPRTDDEENQV